MIRVLLPLLTKTGSPAEARWRRGAKKRICVGNAKRGLALEQSKDARLAVKTGLKVLGFLAILKPLRLRASARFGLKSYALQHSHHLMLSDT